MAIYEQAVVKGVFYPVIKSISFRPVAEWGSGGLFEGNPWGLMGFLQSNCAAALRLPFCARPMPCGQSNHLFEVAAVPRLMIIYLEHFFKILSYVAPQMDRTASGASKKARSPWSTRVESSSWVLQ